MSGNEEALDMEAQDQNEIGDHPFLDEYDNPITEEDCLDVAVEIANMGRFLPADEKVLDEKFNPRDPAEVHKLFNRVLAVVNKELFPVYDWVDEWSDVIYNSGQISIVSMGYDDYALSADNHLKGGLYQLASMLCQVVPANYEVRRDERADKLWDVYGLEYPGISLDLYAGDLMDRGAMPLKFEAVAAMFEYVYHSTGNWFLDLDNETLWSSGDPNIEWEADLVEWYAREWRAAEEIFDQLSDFDIRMSENKSFRFEVVDFIGEIIERVRDIAEAEETEGDEQDSG